MSGYDGWVTIGTNLDTKQLEKEIRQAETDLKKFDKEAEKLTKRKAKLEVDVKDYEKAQKRVSIMKQAVKELEEELASGVSGIRYQDITYEMDKATTEINNLNLKINKHTQGYKDAKKELEEINEWLSKSADRQANLVQNAQKFREQLKKAKEVEEIKGSIDKIGTSLKRVVNQVLKWGAAVFGIRSAYMAVRQAMNTLSQYDDQMATNIEYIRYALANMLKPVVEYILNLVIKLLTYVNFLANAWFGINLFSRSSANNFADAKDNLHGANKEADKLKKTLAGFDEMNIIGDSDDGGAGGGIGSLLPSFDLSSLKNIDAPSWLKWLAKNGKTVAIIIGAIGAALLTWKLGNLIAKMTGVTEGLLAFKAGLALVAAGAVLLIGEIINIIYSWDNMSKSQKTLAVALAGLGAAMIALGTSIALGLSVATLGIGALIAGVVALITALGSLIVKQESNHKSATDLKAANEALKEAQDNLKTSTDEYISAVENAEEAQQKLKEAQDQTGLSGEDLYNKVKEGTLNYKDMDATQREVYKAYVNNINAQERLEDATKKMTEATKEEERATWNQKIANEKSAEGFNKLKDEIVKAYNEGKISAKDARDYIERCMADMDNTSRQTFTQNLPNSIKDGLNPDRYSSTWTRFKNSWNNFWDGLKTKLGMEINTNVSGSGIGYAKGGVVGYAKGGVVKCASGAVVSRPGRGVPINAIAGEGGASGSVEGVIPLTDAQQMSLLGEAIGRYITVNLTNINSMNGKVLSRELKTLQSESEFAFNR